MLAGDSITHPEAFQFDQTILAIGDILIVPFPFESVLRNLAAHAALLEICLYTVPVVR